MNGNKDQVRIGIDLGTTNSSIAINNGLSVEVINNSEGSLFTPSVVGVNRNGNVVVGTEAYDQLFKNATTRSALNNIAEVKRKMGLDEKIHFPLTKTFYSPEEVSSEILKVLKNDLLRRYSDISTLSAVITIPMAFGTVQSEATKRAGELAGFEHVVILQEPIAAAFAYGLKNNLNENWLVYDLGGGTFDVALIGSKDGSISVLEHGGNNYLGGKDFDELIIQQIIKPQILKRYKFANLNLSQKDEKYGVTYSHLKSIAESSKIKLTTKTEVSIDIYVVKMNIGKIEPKDGDFTDDDGKIVDFTFNLTRAEYERVISPKVDETIALSKKIIEKSNLKSDSISKIILVGASTLTPIIRHRLEKELKIKVDSSMNPFTVVAEGAAIFALGQKTPKEILDKHRTVSKDEIPLLINYDALTSDLDMLVTGKIDVTEKKDLYIKISSDNGFFNSEKIKLKNNTFSAYIGLEERKQNNFWIYLIDEKGNNLNVQPNNFSVTHGLNVNGAPIPHNVGVMYSQQQANGKWEQRGFNYFDRKAKLPLSRRETFKTISEISRGEKVILPIEVYEGDNEDPKLNNVVTRLEINGENIPYSLKEGSEIDILITISESRILEVEVYIPEIDMTLDARTDTYARNINDKQITAELKEAQNDLADIGDQLPDFERKELNEEIDNIKNTIKNNNDQETKQKADGQLKELKNRIFNLKNSTQFSRLVEEYNKIIQDIEEALNDSTINLDSEKFEAIFNGLKSKAEAVIESKNETNLKYLIEELNNFHHAVISSSPQYWAAMIVHLSNEKGRMRNQERANILFKQANAAFAGNDVDTLKQCTIELIGLLPRDSQASIQDKIAGITR